MAQYAYKGQDSNGKNTSGVVSAANRNEAVSILRKRRIKISEIKIKSSGINLSFGGGVKLADVSRFTRQFAAMTSAGLPLVQCMDILSEQADNPIMGAAVKQISMDIQGGSALAESMAKHPKVFSSLYCNMVEAGEQSGNLDGVLTRLAEYQEKSNAIVRKVKGAMSYPIVLICIVVAAVSLLLTFVVPQFAAMFSDLGGSLPVPTLIVMAISDFLKKYILLIILAVVGMISGIRKYYQTDNGALLIDSFMLKVPIFGDLIRKTSISRFSQTLSTLLSSGVGIIKALNITAKTAGNKVIERGLFRTVEKISGGQSITEPLAETGVFPPMVIQMISVGEKTGDISTMLDKIAGFYEEEVDAAVEALTSVLEPIMIVVMGVVVGGILIAMYLPMFDMVNAI